MDPAGGDVYLSAQGASEPLEPGLCDAEFEGDPRDGAPDVVADEI